MLFVPRDRDLEIQTIRALAALDRVSANDNGLTRLVTPPTGPLIEQFEQRTGDGEIRPHVILLGDAEAMEECADGVAYGVWRSTYGDTTDYAKTLRSQAVAKLISAHHLFFMANQVDELDG